MRMATPRGSSHEVALTLENEGGKLKRSLTGRRALGVQGWPCSVQRRLPLLPSTRAPCLCPPSCSGNAFSFAQRCLGSNF